MVNHHEPLNALGPVEWDEVPQSDLNKFLTDIFAETQTIIESIPSSTSAIAPAAAPAEGRARAQTDSAVGVDADMQRSLALLKSPDAVAQAHQLRKDWKEAKVNAKDNPLDISVHKMSAKDGKGAWFARRSIHEGLGFDEWKSGLAREFGETMKVQGSPGSGNIRGIGAERVAEHHDVPDVGQVDVYQLSAQFPGPTTPRDFITLLLTGESSYKLPGEARPLRQYVVVSKPCAHPDCPPRQGIIRGRYESVEVIREIPSEVPVAKRSLSSADLLSNESKRTSIAKDIRPESAEEVNPPSIEWLMVTRSDPGGSVPRFMIEKGTPPGIVGDAGKFLKWITSHSDEDSSAGNEDANPSEKEVTTTKTTGVTPGGTDQTQTKSTTNTNQQQDDEGFSSSNGLYGMITGAFGAATSVVRKQFDGDANNHDGPSDTQTQDDISDSDTSSVASFTSALEKSNTEDKSRQSFVGSLSDEAKSQTTANTPQEKELKKLQERRRKLDEKYTKTLERSVSRKEGDEEKDAAAKAKLREKHDKEVAKQEEKYQRELRRLEEKQASEERKAEDRRRKTAEREEKANLSLELERTRAERDVALKQVEVLEGSTNELLAKVARLEKEAADLALAKDGALQNGNDTASTPAVSS